MHDTDFRTLAADAYAQAQIARTDEHRAAWLKIAEGYRALADKEEGRASRFGVFFRPRDLA